MTISLARPLRLTLLAALSSCYTSRTVDRVALADTQRGVTGWVRLTDGSVHGGELLALQDASLVMLAVDRVVVAPHSVIRRAEFGGFKSSDMQKLTSVVIDGGRRASRFPYGITSAAMAELLNGARQERPDTLSLARR